MYLLPHPIFLLSLQQGRTVIPGRPDIFCVVNKQIVVYFHLVLLLALSAPIRYYPTFLLKVA